MQSELTRPGAVLWWSITLAWAALVFCLSTRGFGPDTSRALLAWTLNLLHLTVSRGTFGLLHSLLRGLAHLAEYAVLALLLYGLRADRQQGLWRPRWAGFCIAVATAYALTDEFHQWFVAGRHGSLLDCGLDATGAALAMLVPYTWGRISHLRSNNAFSKS
jgi:VanZ family protein